ncbi:uncharacterized protein [Musca autumnalis]|uniref:uncharacterized protein n=1 Tax=Musca autumnalis TaxID=221902 RepID=UPI003CF528AD
MDREEMIARDMKRHGKDIPPPFPFCMAKKAKTLTDGEDCVILDEIPKASIRTARCNNNEKQVLMLKSGTGFCITIYVDGFIYRLNAKSKESNTYRWKCLRSKNQQCWGCIYTELLANGMHRYKPFGSENMKHNHQPITESQLRARCIRKNIDIITKEDCEDEQSNYGAQMAEAEVNGVTQSNFETTNVDNETLNCHDNGFPSRIEYNAATKFRYIPDPSNFIENPYDGDVIFFFALSTINGKKRLLVMDNMIFHYHSKKRLPNYKDEEKWYCMYKKHKNLCCTCLVTTVVNDIRDQMEITAVSGYHNHSSNHGVRIQKMWMANLWKEQYLFNKNKYKNVKRNEADATDIAQGIIVANEPISEEEGEFVEQNLEDEENNRRLNDHDYVIDIVEESESEEEIFGMVCENEENSHCLDDHNYVIDVEDSADEESVTVLCENEEIISVGESQSDIIESCPSISVKEEPLEECGEVETIDITGANNDIPLLEIKNELKEDIKMEYHNEHNGGPRQKAADNMEQCGEVETIDITGANNDIPVLEIKKELKEDIKIEYHNDHNGGPRQKADNMECTPSICIKEEPQTEIEYHSAIKNEENEPPIYVKIETDPSSSPPQYHSQQLQPIFNPDNLDLDKIYTLNSLRGTKLLHVDNYIYELCLVVPTTGCKIWYCSESSSLKCKARITTKTTSSNQLIVTRISNSHSHPPASEDVRM